MVVINAEKIIFSDPDKWDEKEYTWYTGYPGQHLETTRRRGTSAWAEKILSEAVRRMLPKNKLAFKMIKKLKIYSGGEHPRSRSSLSRGEVAVK